MTAVIVMAKECLPGRVKTRLCPPFTAAEAARIAAASLADTLALVRRMPVDRRILAFEGRPHLDTDGFEVHAQVAGSLDLRIGAMLDACAEPALLLGMDTPHVRLDDVDPVFQSWESGADAQDAWLGMASDGGYWALALTRPSGDPVRGVPMSQPDTGACQRAQLERSGYRVYGLPTRTDIDDVRSLQSVLPRAPEGGRLRELFDPSTADASLVRRMVVAA